MLKVIGRIRPGTKVLKRSITDPKAKAIVDRGMQAGVGFPAIDAALNKAGFKHALIPKNEPFFSVWPGEFKNPETAHKILDMYGEMRDGDTVKRLYDFPVAFPHSDPSKMVITRMECYTAKGLKYHSEISASGEPLCITKDDVPKATNGRAVRIYGGRKDKVRGPCEPEKCPEYQRRECNTRSRINVMIPGATNTAEFVEIPTGSFYAVDDIESTLRYTAELCGGRIPVEVQLGWKNNPIFWMTKVREKVKHITDEGEPEMVPQILAHLNCKADLAHLLSLADAITEKHRMLSGAFLPQGVKQAPAALEYQSILHPEDIVPNNLRDMEQVRTEQAIHSGPEAEVADFQGETSHEEQLPQQTHDEQIQPETSQSPNSSEQQTVAAKSNQPAAESPVESKEADKAAVAEVRSLRKIVTNLCGKVGIDPMVFLEYGNARFGQNWGKNLDCLKSAEQELQQAIQADDLEGYIAEVNNVIHEARQSQTESA